MFFQRLKVNLNWVVFLFIHPEDIAGLGLEIQKQVSMEIGELSVYFVVLHATSVGLRCLACFLSEIQ